MRTHFPAAASATHALLRIVAGLLFMLHGGQKLFGWFGGVGPNGGTVPLVSQMGLAGVLELVGGALILVGLFTRPVGFLLAGEMAAAYFIAHLPRAFWPIQNQGESAALFAFIFLFFAFNGAGRFSLDGLRSRGEARVERSETPRRRDRAA